MAREFSGSYSPSDIVFLFEPCDIPVMKKYGISDINKIKPGIAEATRAVSRRTPVLTLVRNPHDPELAFLIEKSCGLGIPVITENTEIYRAIAIIR